MNASGQEERRQDKEGTGDRTGLGSGWVLEYSSINKLQIFYLHVKVLNLGIYKVTRQ